eukprot:Nitzschia sp. Nitz4//scaffold47_size129522//2747//7063//NITZ4_003531-RA/size129522-processed-gene-0.151-mRNA-1//-1//CDS//3329552740//6821//frame0
MSTADQVGEPSEEFPVVWVSSQDKSNDNTRAEAAWLVDQGEDRHLIQWQDEKLHANELEYVTADRVSFRRSSPRKRNRSPDSHRYSSPKSTPSRDTKRSSPSKSPTAGRAQEDLEGVQVVLTILPPSPAKNTSSTRSVGATVTPTPLSFQDARLEPLQTVLDSSTSNQMEAPLDSKSPPSPKTISSSPNPYFSYRTSAYLQSLAEICHAMLWDARWRTHGSASHNLLAWECGDDLSAVHALARRYIPPSGPLSTEKSQDDTSCSCLLCAQRVVLPSFPQTNDAPTSPTHSPTKSTNTKDTSVNANTSESDNNPNEDEEAYDRSLNLYARMYFRKGPWFRIDDLFKYYLPRSSNSRSNQEASTESASLDQEDTSALANVPATPTTPSNNSKASFFLPKTPKSTSSAASTHSPVSVDTFVDQDFINQQLEAVVYLLEDLEQLASMGLLRSFQSEQECGQTVGHVLPKAKNGVLRQEERRQVLLRLGGSEKKTSPGPKAMNSQNLIWKQMCQQQSIIRGTHAHSILPVSKHVDSVLLSSWATGIVLRAARRNYVPQAMLKSLSTHVQKILLPLVSDYLGRTTSQSGFLSSVCWRLREPPLKSLRRCCRLFLCATSGPGEMRGTSGTNGWKSLPNEDKFIQAGMDGLPDTNVVSPPGSHSWGSTVYPGRDHRLKLIPCNFQRAYKPLIVSSPMSPDPDQLSRDDPTALAAQLFDCRASFLLWELCVDIRANVDYLMEANELGLYNKRKRAKQRRKEGLEEESESESLPTQQSHDTLSVDFLDLLSKSGRDRFLAQFFSKLSASDDPIKNISREIERDLASFLVPTGDHFDDLAERDCERVLGTMCVLLTHILTLQNQCIDEGASIRMISRPWLRHLWWEGVLSYALWDIIPILERRGLYKLATDALQVLLFGKQVLSLSNDIDLLVVPNFGEGAFRSLGLLSRRARGKAFERLVIDYIHYFRMIHKKDYVPSQENDKAKKKKLLEMNRLITQKTKELTTMLCKEFILGCVPSGLITFCAARTLAKRLKQPLSETLKNLDIFEVIELGHRLENSPMTKVHSSSDVNSKVQYIDWLPPTDKAIAHAMATDNNEVGGRCSYVGFEEQENDTDYGSLNVEELAMEYYRTGRLPHADESYSGLKGGWVGWHDEGGKIRTLFRILSSAFILGTDWGCPLMSKEFLDEPSIHVTPYQGAPFDLHVGAEKSAGGPRRLGFYERRKGRIEAFLCHLENLSPQDIADLVYNSVYSRWYYSRQSRQGDPALERDILQLRTLSAIASGFGGKHLSSMLRCFFFDYRHYSGGLPDLTLIRAHSESGALVDLGTWVGESFSADDRAHQENMRVLKMLEDQDEDFLGCERLGDSGARNNARFRASGSTMNASRQRLSTVSVPMPPPLRLLHDDSPIVVECMLVEVKSTNDRLDARQKDWLNIIDKHGNGRVCKFEAK